MSDFLSAHAHHHYSIIDGESTYHDGAWLLLSLRHFQQLVERFVRGHRRLQTNRLDRFVAALDRQVGEHLQSKQREQRRKLLRRMPLLILSNESVEKQEISNVRFFC